MFSFSSRHKQILELENIRHLMTNRQTNKPRQEHNILSGGDNNQQTRNMSVDSYM